MVFYVLLFSSKFEMQNIIIFYILLDSTIDRLMRRQSEEKVVPLLLEGIDGFELIT